MKIFHWTFDCRRFPKVLHLYDLSSGLFSSGNGAVSTSTFRLWVERLIFYFSFVRSFGFVKIHSKNWIYQKRWLHFSLVDIFAWVLYALTFFYQSFSFLYILLDNLCESLILLYHMLFAAVYIFEKRIVKWNMWWVSLVKRFLISLIFVSITYNANQPHTMDIFNATFKIIFSSESWKNERDGVR